MEHTEQVVEMKTIKETINGATKRKMESVDGPAMKIRKEELYDMLLTNDCQWKIEITSAEEKTQKNLADPKMYNSQLTARQVLVFNLDKSRTDEFYQEFFNKSVEPTVEKAEKVVIGGVAEHAGKNFEGMYLTTFSTSEEAKSFVEMDLLLKHWDVGLLPVKKVFMKQYLMDEWIQSDLIRSKNIRAQVKEIEVKLDLEARKSEGVTVACCVVVNLYNLKTESEVTELDVQLSLVNEQAVLKEVVLVKTFKTKHKGRGHSFVLIFKTEEAALKFSDYKQVHKFRDSSLNVIMLTNMVAKQDFTKKAKDFEDDPAYAAADDSRRIIVTTTATIANKNSASGKDRALWLSQHPWDTWSPELAAILENHFKETRTGFESCHQARIPQLGRPDVVWGLQVVTFTDPAAALLALNVTDKDKEIIYRPERMMLLTEYMRRREEALERDQRRKAEVGADKSGDSLPLEIGQEGGQKKKGVAGLDNSQEKNPVCILIDNLGPLDFKTEQTGEPKAVSFTSQVTIEGTIFSGQGTSKKAAKIAAAQSAVEGLSLAPGPVGSQKKKSVTESENSQREKHPVSILIAKLGPIDFKIEQTEFMSSMRNLDAFTARVIIEGTTYSGEGNSKKSAKKAAAQSAVEALYGAQ